tara:strand:- start:3348 stop:3764 length:417 start_codon:yes stop_codon:yes gene_type:complete
MIGAVMPPLSFPVWGSDLEYNNDFKYDLKIGQIAEKWLGQLLSGKTLEVKRDFRASQTGKVFVEFFCRGKPSGIATTEADFWAFVIDGDYVVILPTEDLKEIVEFHKQKGWVMSGGDNNVSQGALVRVERLIKNAISS